MDFMLSEGHQSDRKMFKGFAERELRPLAREIDEAERFPTETVEKLARAGFLGLIVPKAFSGRGYDALTYILAIEEFARVCASTAVIVSTHTTLGCGPLMMFGTEEQKRKYLAPLAEGRALGAFALSEAGAGTDVAAIAARAEADGDHYRLSGEKVMVSNGGRADVFIIFASTDPAKGAKGLSAFIVEKNFSGLEIGPEIKKMGIRGSSTCDLTLKDCPVPKANLLGEENQAFKYAMQVLDTGRIGIAAQALGIARGALELATNYVKERRQFGRPLAAFQNTQFSLAQMATEVEAARLLTYKAALLKDRGRKFSTEAAMAKLFASEMAMRVTTACVQLYGGYGYLRDYQVERMMRDAKITSIYEGTSEVQKMLISAAALK